jgi:hypothetical protein
MAEMLTKEGVFGVVAGHQNRHLVIDPKSGAGSVGNIGVEPEPKATIQRFDPDGSNQSTVVSGTRNPTALAFHPDTGELWALVQQRDGLGDNLPSDYLIRVQRLPRSWAKRWRPCGPGNGQRLSTGLSLGMRGQVRSTSCAGRAHTRK